MTLPQGVKKVLIVSDSLGLVDFATGLVISFLNLPDGQMKFFGRTQITEELKSKFIKNFFKLVEMTFGLVRASYSLPEWQAVKSSKTDFLCTLLPSLYKSFVRQRHCHYLPHLFHTAQWIQRLDAWTPLL